MLGAIGWQLHKRILRRPVRRRIASGVSFIAHPDCVVSSSLIYADWPEFAEFQFLRNRLTPGEMVIDVGANVGHVSLLLADIVDPKDIVAIEPTPLTFQRLRANWEINGWPFDNLLQCAVGSEAGTVRISDSDHPLTTNAILTNSGSNQMEVPLVALDDCRDRWQGRSVGLLKIDVEGFEGEVFAGARVTLSTDRPKVIMFESLEGRIEPRIAEMLSEADYVAIQLDKHGLPVNANPLDAQNLFALPREIALAENIG
jgi:FkbM family methyltransferase